MQNIFTHSRSVLFKLLLILFGLFLLSAHANALSTGWLQNPNHPPLETRFVITGQMNEQEKAVAGFLEVRLSGGWKTYWRNPGEGGIAPSMTWENSKNLRDVIWYWPHPKRFNVLGIETLGYKGRVVFPMTLLVKDMNAPVTFKSNLTLSSCTTICVLTDFPFELTFTPSKLTLSENAMHVYAQALSQVPRASALIRNVNAIWDQSKNKLQVSILKDAGWKNPDVLIDGTSEEIEDATFRKPIIHIEGEKLTATFDVTSWISTPNLTGEDISITLSDGDFIAEQTTRVLSQNIEEGKKTSLLKMFLFALLGGFILNIMPCVLPVLGMKLSGVITAKELKKKQIRFQFLASATGIVFSFWLIALFLFGLKLTGNAIGWGIQFQNPWFIGLMVLITALFSANMLGLFEVKLSSNTSTWIASKGDSSYLGHFTQGLFATLLATPCSAPFLGAAVAFALATNTLTMFFIFTGLGLGMALPWILIALFPSIALALPKPGRWMIYIKYLFGLMMLITSIWLLSLLSHHLPGLLIYNLGIGLVVIMIARTFFVYGKKAAPWIASLFVALLCGGLLIASITTEKWVSPLPAEPDWTPLSTSDIQKAVREGKVVFVDITAKWCITCKANKIGVLLQEPVYSELNNQNLIPMQGDWTRPSENITSYLQANGRFGVPFNVVYGPGAPNGIALPVILNSSVVMDAIKKAKGLNPQ